MKKVSYGFLALADLAALPGVLVSAVVESDTSRLDAVIEDLNKNLVGVVKNEAAKECCDAPCEQTRTEA